MSLAFIIPSLAVGTDNAAVMWWVLVLDEDVRNGLGADVTADLVRFIIDVVLTFNDHLVID